MQCLKYHHYLKVNEYEEEYYYYSVEVVDSTLGANSNQWSGNIIIDKIIISWFKKKKHIFHKYSLVGFYLSPNPGIMKEFLDNKT